MATQIIPSRSVLLFLDYQVLHEKTQPEMMKDILDRAAGTIKLAKEKGVVVAHCRMAFDDDQSANLPETNMLFAGLAKNPTRLAMMHVDSPEAAFHEKVAPQEGDIVFRKNRIGPFQGKGPHDFRAILKDRGIDTLIVGGVATGGAVLATVVQAADLDYRIVVLEDCCGDPDPDLHRVLVDKILKKRGVIINSTDLENLIGV
jgi:nicotinamidase-related amidase